MVSRIRELSLRPLFLGGIELMHTIAKGQLKSDGGRYRSVAERFYDFWK